MNESVVTQQLDDAREAGETELERLLHEATSLSILLGLTPDQLHHELKRAIDHHYPF